MADRDSTRATRTRGVYYQPAAEIRSVPGVFKVECCSRVDHYTGTVDALVATGIAPLSLFPGQPGIAITTASYRPAGPVASGGQCWAPGYMSIFRNPSGKFRIALTVSSQEQARRKAELTAKDAEQKDDYEARQKELKELRGLEVRTLFARRTLKEATCDEATFRAKSQEMMWMMASGIIALLGSKNGTFRYLDADAERIRAELSGVYHGLLKLPVRRDPDAPARAAAALSAIEDAAFQSVLGKLMSEAERERGSSAA